MKRLKSPPPLTKVACSLMQAENHRTQSGTKDNPGGDLSVAHGRSVKTCCGAGHCPRRHILVMTLAAQIIAMFTAALLLFPRFPAAATPTLTSTERILVGIFCTTALLSTVFFLAYVCTANTDITLTQPTDDIVRGALPKNYTKTSRAEQNTNWINLTTMAEQQENGDELSRAKTDPPGSKDACGRFVQLVVATTPYRGNGPAARDCFMPQLEPCCFQNTKKTADKKDEDERNACKRSQAATRSRGSYAGSPAPAFTECKKIRAAEKKNAPMVTNLDVRSRLFIARPALEIY